MAFSKNIVGPVNKAFEKGQQPDAGTLGPNAPAKQDPKAFMNTWAAKLYGDQADARTLYDNNFFPAEAADNFRDRVYNMTDYPTFNDPNDNDLANKFLEDYRNSTVLGEGEKVYKESLSHLVSQQPAQGVGLGTSASRMKFAGTNSTSVA